MISVRTDNDEIVMRVSTEGSGFPVVTFDTHFDSVRAKEVAGWLLAAAEDIDSSYPSVNREYGRR